MRFCAFLAIVVVAASIPACAQYAPTSPAPSFPGQGSSVGSTDAKRYSLSGTVVNSVTNEPIRRALVTLFYQQQLSAMTDSDGRFEFEDLPRMSVNLAAQKPGFFSEQELSSGRHRPKQYAVGPEAPAAVIKLVPEAIVSGRVVDPDGLPIPGLMIRAVTQKVMEGRKQWTQGTVDRTDADGYFRIINLMPGSYFLVAGPRRNLAFVSGAEDTSDFGYPAVVYPGTLPMRISAGQQLEANFTIKPEPFHSVTGSVSGGAPGSRYSIQLVPRLPGVRMPAAGAMADTEAGTFTIPRVASGDYILQARAFVMDRDNPGASHSQLFGSMPITVRGNLMGVTVPLEPMLTIPINVRMEKTKQQKIGPGANAPAVQVRLVSDDQDRMPAFSGPEDPKNPNSQLVLKNATPGRYRIELSPTFGDSYVASARFGTTDLLNGEITLTRSASQGEIDVVVRDDGAHLRMKLQGDDADAMATILVVPDRGQPIVQDVSVKAEMQLFTSLRPGSYSVLAFQDIGNLEYTNRNALEPYLSRGVRITLTPNQQATVSPDIIKAVTE